MARRGTGSLGKRIQLLTNHFRVDMGRNKGYFFHYDVALRYEDGKSVQAKGIGRKVLAEVWRTNTELEEFSFAYDGGQNLFTLDPLPCEKQQYTVELKENLSRRVGRIGRPDINYETTIPLRAIENAMNDQHSRNSSEAPDDALNIIQRQHAAKLSQYRLNIIIVDINYVTKIPLHEIANALSGQNSRNFQESLKVLNMVLRQHDAERILEVVCKPAVVFARPFEPHKEDYLSTLPGPVVDFLLQSQNVGKIENINWTKVIDRYILPLYLVVEAKRMLKNLRIEVNGVEFKITGLSDYTCRNQKFLLRQKDEENENEITVYDYFTNNKMISLHSSADIPCINVATPQRPSYFPIELCVLVSMQRYTKALTNLQRAQVVKKTRQCPKERKADVEKSLRSNKYEDECMLRSLDINIDLNITQLEGRVLQPPKLVVGNKRDITPLNGRWNFFDEQLFAPMTIDKWAVVSFSSECDTTLLIQNIEEISAAIGMNMKNILHNKVIEENFRFINQPAHVRVEQMHKKLHKTLPGKPSFLLCILPNKNSDIYGPWKKKFSVDDGVVTQCISAQQKFDRRYITNVLLKINLKFGGMNTNLSREHEKKIPIVFDKPTLILGMHVSHGSPARSNVPSIAAVASSRCWPQITRYRAAVRAQSAKNQMIQSLFMSDDADYPSEDKGIIRDGVSESQFKQVLNDELNQIIQACKLLDEDWDPKFTLIVAQKNHHTRFFNPKDEEYNVPIGTVIDSTVCDPKNNDFYLCAQVRDKIKKETTRQHGTTRPVHYHVLHDEIGFSTDELQELVHSLSYTYQISTSAVSLVAPLCYARLAARQMAKFVKCDKQSKASLRHGGDTSSAAHPLPILPQQLMESMYFC
ncbi:unnamed protein product [Sphenostylis stenocarpa]|uniref:Uncharacterized protein n=1 Tax=Sphenostylis stenocarpa TaxID=92480 RepID=A0AA86TB33_9FABA|nr:unnamed protein product [Sphenostylis stenocarpa]